ncbi:crotonase/enoyl-CoA hydratase family protein [Ferrovibrio sp.]|uniref:crotonase/enoyl-CoA hydratase family protein n=1 Tax=Ferrovibrio sp. TaxID=1917215 RepID=UPI003D09D13C
MAAILTEQRDALLIITLNRPEARNAINAELAQGLDAALTRLDADPTLRVGIIQGAGGTFCAGMDLKAFVRGESSYTPKRGFGGITEKPAEKPLIAAVEGFALAGGCEVALSCDLIVAAETARFGLPEVKRGLIAAAGGLMRLPRQLPYRLAMEMALTGDMYEAALMHQHGLINRLVPAGGALAAALELAARITPNAPLSVAGTKRTVVESRDWPQDGMFERQFAISKPISASADAIEGATAFAEKRAPVWRGK